MRNVVVIIPSFNNEKWCEKNLKSVFSQDYPNFRVIYTDDCSSDNTYESVQNYVYKNNLLEKIDIIRNKERLGALNNIYEMIHSCDDEDIIVDLDGDDWFYNDNVLSRIVKEYETGEVWLTFGSYIDYPGNTRGCAKPYERNIINTNSFRRTTWRASHCRTRLAWLFKKIKKEDLLDHEGNFFNSAWDCAYQFPMLEMAGHRHRYIHDILYCYNNQNPLSDYKIRAEEQAKFDRMIRTKKSYSLL